MEPKVINVEDVKEVGGGFDGDWHSVPIRELHSIANVCKIGVCTMKPDQETCVFSFLEKDDLGAEHYYGPVDEFYYILKGKFKVWWGKEATNLEDSFELKEGDCTYYPAGWNYKVKNIGNTPGTFLYFITTPEGIMRRTGWKK